MRYHKLRIEQAKQDWLNQSFLSDTAEKSERENLLALGKCQGILLMLALTVEEVNEFISEMELEIRNG